jgi:ferredoxin--NADP+ reductase
VPFDETRGTIPNERGRVADRVYAAGWIKRGPSGVIGTNKKDAAETVETLLADLRDAPRLGRTFDDVEELLDGKAVRHIVYAGWSAIDDRERAAGEPHGRPRVKLCTWDELLEAAGIASPAKPT